MMAGAGEIRATDIDPSRVEMIDDTVRRLQLPNVKTAVQDALSAPAVGQGLLYDKVLLDAPCSGLGVLRRHADLRWNRKQPDIAKMAARQVALLSAVAPSVRPSGVLVYSTCTLTWEENEGVWKDFLQKHPQFHALDPAGRAGEASLLFAQEPFVGEGYRYILPQEHGTDGFFVACAAREG
jgi:16S rRNA (cytosine967-C5)-methyltransferase